MTLFGPKNAPFPRKNANLTNGAYFTRPPDLPPKSVPGYATH